MSGPPVARMPSEHGPIHVLHDRQVGILRLPPLMDSLRRITRSRPSDQPPNPARESDFPTRHHLSNRSCGPSHRDFGRRPASVTARPVDRDKALRVVSAIPHATAYLKRLMRSPSCRDAGGSRPRATAPLRQRPLELAGEVNSSGRLEPEPTCDAGDVSTEEGGIARHWHPTSAPGSTGCSRISTGLRG